MLVQKQFNGVGLFLVCNGIWLCLQTAKMSAKNISIQNFSQFYFLHK